jgi:DNA-binding transcriptional MerR regulator
MYIDEDRLEEMYSTLMKRFEHIEHKLERMSKVNACLDGDTLLDDQDMCELLGVTKRTLARYRQKKLVTYYMIDRRAYYRSSEIQGFLKRKGQQS